MDYKLHWNGGHLMAVLPGAGAHRSDFVVAHAIHATPKSQAYPAFKELGEMTINAH